MSDKTVIIAEAGVNHNGNINIAKELVRKAKEVGLKYVKLQTYKSGSDRISDKVKSANYYEKVTQQEESLVSMFDKYKLSESEERELFHYTKELGIQIFSTPFDPRMHGTPM